MLRTISTTSQQSNQPLRRCGKKVSLRNGKSVQVRAAAMSSESFEDPMVLDNEPRHVANTNDAVTHRSMAMNNYREARAKKQAANAMRDANPVQKPAQKVVNRIPSNPIAKRVERVIPAQSPKGWAASFAPKSKTNDQGLPIKNDTKVANKVPTAPMNATATVTKVEQPKRLFGIFAGGFQQPAIRRREAIRVKKSPTPKKDFANSKDLAPRKPIKVRNGPKLPIDLVPVTDGGFGLYTPKAKPQRIQARQEPIAKKMDTEQKHTILASDLPIWTPVKKAWMDVLNPEASGRLEYQSVFLKSLTEDMWYEVEMALEDKPDHTYEDVLREAFRAVTVSGLGDEEF